VDGRLAIRDVTDADAHGLIALVAAAYREHPGCVLDLPGVDDDLSAPATAAAGRGGRWWVVHDGQQVVASVGTGPRRSAGRLELKRLYVRATHRRQGVATALLRRVEAHAAGLGASVVELWSDTRFTAAHALYGRHGYADTGQRRELDDPSDTTEIRFQREVVPAAPNVERTWAGPTGAAVCERFDLPDGWLLRGRTASSEHAYEVELDGRSRVRRAALRAPSGRAELTSDGAGHWWCDGHRSPELDGCSGVQLGTGPAALTLPLPRTDGVEQGGVELLVARVHLPGPEVVARAARFERRGAGRWRYVAGGEATELTAVGEGPPVAVGDV
jgi:GNAT superfamily N-acetyltransferase